MNCEILAEEWVKDFCELPRHKFPKDSTSQVNFYVDVLQLSMDNGLVSYCLLKNKMLKYQNKEEYQRAKTAEVSDTTMVHIAAVFARTKNCNQ